METQKYAAGIVLYNPEIDRLRANLDAVSAQVGKVYCFDNGSKNLSDTQRLLNDYDNVCLIDGKANLGIATALNRVLEQAKSEGYEWLITLDQDSVLCDGMIESFSRWTDMERVAMICPQIQDVRRKNLKPVEVSDKVADVDTCITSGCFMHIDRTIEIGGLDDVLFIGHVDYEVCVRARYKGYRILRDYSVVLDHELGNLTASKYAHFLLWLGNMMHNENIKKLSYNREVSPFRMYYAVRNTIYLRRKYKRVTKTAPWNKCLTMGVLASYIRSGYNFEVLKAAIRGWRDCRVLKVEQL